eukprot:3921687-Prymnesium_polylepis.1
MCDELQCPIGDDLRIVALKLDVPHKVPAVTSNLVENTVRWRTALAATYSAQEIGERCDVPCGHRRWWQQMRSCSDDGLQDIIATSQGVDASGKWRVEWREARAEQLQLQGESHLAAAERELPGRPESIDWIRDAYWAQINFLVREEAWKPAVAEAYTLIACCAPTAMARATRDMLQLRRMSSARVHAD